MSRQAPGAQAVLLDTDIVIALLKGDALVLLGGIRGFDFQITGVNRLEVKRKAQQQRLDRELSGSSLSLTPLTDPAGLDAFSRLNGQLDKGEAAVIASAAVNNAEIAMRDQAGRSLARAALPSSKVHSLADILAEAIQQQVVPDQPMRDTIHNLERADEYHPPSGAPTSNSLTPGGDYGLR